MADEEFQQERTEQPTQRRLEESRKTGQIARSRELNTFVALLAGSAGFIILGDRMMRGLAGIMRGEFLHAGEAIGNPKAPIGHLGQVLIDGFLVIAPFAALMVVAAIVSSVALGGWICSWESLSPKAEKLNPIRNLGRLFSLRTLVELAKSLFKVAVVMAVTWLIFKRDFDDLLRIGHEWIQPALVHSGKLITQGFLYLSASLVVIAAFDVPYQLWEYKRHLKMTRQEVLEEMKEAEGRPEVKARIRRLQLEMARRRMMDEVPKADVVITNPTRYAVALKYDHARASAPVVVAKGSELVALRIRELAEEHDVAVVSAPPLARALYHSVELGEQIPEALYQAVAQILAYVYQLRFAQQYGQPIPDPPRDLPVSDDLTRPVH